MRVATKNPALAALALLCAFGRDGAFVVTVDAQNFTNTTGEIEVVEYNGTICSKILNYTVSDDFIFINDTLNVPVAGDGGDDVVQFGERFAGQNITNRTAEFEEIQDTPSDPLTVLAGPLNSNVFTQDVFIGGVGAVNIPGYGSMSMLIPLLGLGLGSMSMLIPPGRNHIGFRPFYASGGSTPKISFYRANGELIDAITLSADGEMVVGFQTRNADEIRGLTVENVGGIFDFTLPDGGFCFGNYAPLPSSSPSAAPSAAPSLSTAPPAAASLSSASSKTGKSKSKGRRPAKKSKGKHGGNTKAPRTKSPRRAEARNRKRFRKSKGTTTRGRRRAR